MATGHIRKRVNKNGSVSYQITVESERDPVTGKRERHYKSVSGTKKQAELTMRKMISELEDGGIVKTSAMKTGVWMKEWLSLYVPNIEATTRDGYRDKIENYIIPVLGDIPINVLKTAHIQGWVQGLQGKGLAPKTIRNAYNNLNAAMKKAVVLRMIMYNPCTGVVLPKMSRYQAKVYNSADVNNLLAIAKETDLYLVITLLTSTGMRRGELLALKWKNVDLDNRIIHVKENIVQAGTQIVEKAPKSAAGIRDITIGSDVVSVLSAAKLQYFRDRADGGAGFQDLGYVIHKPDGTPYRPDALTRKWERFLERNNLPSIRLHDLRHTHATLLIQAGVSPKVVQQRLGHSDVTITLNTYTHVLSSMDQEAADKLDNIINF